MLNCKQILTAILVKRRKGMTFLADYKTMYCRLCRAADDAVSMIEDDTQNAEAAAALLREALLDAEALFLEAN